MLCAKYAGFHAGFGGINREMLWFTSFIHTLLMPFSYGCGSALPSLSRFNYAPGLQVPEKTYENPEAGGQNRYKYFRRPIIPFLPQMPPNVLLAPTMLVLNKMTCSIRMYVCVACIYNSIHSLALPM